MLHQLIYTDFRLFFLKLENGQELPVIYQPVYETQGLPDTVYEIRAAEDVVTPDGTLRYSKGELVDTVTTDETGFAKSKELYLGKYEVKEVKAGYGMVLSSEVHTVELKSRNDSYVLSYW